MTWTCELVDYPGDWTEMNVGQMFYGPTYEEACSLNENSKWDSMLGMYARNLSDYYRANNSGRRPLFVILPDRVPFCMDAKCFNGEFYGGWTVTGEAPVMTVSPSINLGNTYHGWLRDGVISEDCEGRKYDDQGYLIRS